MYNLLYRGGDSYNGYHSKIVNELKRKDIIKTCFYIEFRTDGKDCFEGDFCQVFASEIGYTDSYEEVVKMEELIPLTREILEGMSPYIDMALNLGMKYTNIPVLSYEESKEKYLRSLRFWNHILEKYKINALFYNILPHNQWEYILVALSHVKKIKMLITDACQFRHKFVYGYSFDTMGIEIRKRYNEMNSEDISLSEEMLAYIRNQKKRPNNPAISSRKSVDFKTTLRYSRKDVFYCYTNINKSIRRFLSDIKKIFLAKRCNNQELVYRRKMFMRQHIRWYFRALGYIIRCQKLRKYNKMAKFPDLTCRFIYFPLHQQPESTTMPRAGFFSNQELSIQILSKSLEGTDIKIYVKEHYTQLYREHEFYQKIQSIPRVELIKTSVDSRQLADNCIAVATQTGSCIWEGIIRNKPALVFGDIYFWQGAPGLYKVGNEEECKKVIRELQNGQINIKECDVERYLSAFEQTCVHCFYVFEDAWYNRNRPSAEESQKEILNLLIKVFGEDEGK